MPKRSNLDSRENPIKYILGALLLLAISGIGIFYLTSESAKHSTEQNVVEKILPTVTVEVLTTISPTAAKTVTPTPKAIENFVSTDEGFSVDYNGERKQYQENEGSGKRYIFYSTLGNITVHVGKSWSWLYPERTFTDDLLVSGEKSFVFENKEQKIVDVEKNNRKYTIQCVHNGSQKLKTECDKFLVDFKFI
jgi:hypothetical protein